MVSGREAAFLAIVDFETVPVHETLARMDLSSSESSFAREIAAGTVKRLLTVKYFAKKLAAKLHLHRKEKALLFSAIYQHVFMDKVPLYAIVNETTSLAKKYFGEKKSRFFHAILHKLATFQAKVPGKNNAFDLSLRLSYPPYFIKKMLEEYGAKQTIALLEIMNEKGLIMCRLRKIAAKKRSFVKVHQDVYAITDVLRWVNSSDLYIQNVTPVVLFDTLRKKLTKDPEKILALCCSTGGTLVLSHDRFPNAQLYANDVAEKKRSKMQENLDKYAIKAHLSKQKAELFRSENRYDLIIIDAPCSYSGIYHKRPEVRWRFCPKTLEDLSDLQADILENAVRYLRCGGQIWYMSCSILSEENEDTVAFAASLGLDCVEKIKILPNEKGWDGGFAAAFVAKKSG